MGIEINTADNLEYTFYPAGYGVFNFKVRAPNDAHIALTRQAMEDDHIVEIFIGGWGNTKSVIRKSKTKPEKVEAETPDILSAGEYRGFWIRWTQDNIITVGREGEAAAFLSWQDSDPIRIGHVGISTGWGAAGSWIIEEAAPSHASLNQPSSGGTLCWVAASNGDIPEAAISGGQDGELLYVARAKHEGAIIPGKLVPSHGVCYVAWGGGEHGHSEYEVLCGDNAAWLPVSGDALPPQVLPAGESDDGEPLFVGRAHHEGTVTIGKVQPSHGVCYISYGGEELSYKDYEVLVSM